MPWEHIEGSVEGISTEVELHHNLRDYVMSNLKAMCMHGARQLSGRAISTVRLDVKSVHTTGIQGVSRCE